MSRETRSQAQTALVKCGEERREKEARLKAWKIARAKQLFEQGTIGIMDEGAAKARAYFTQRGVDLADVATLAAGNFRFGKRAEYWPDAKWQEHEGRRIKRQEGRKIPAIAAAVRDEKGVICGCHLTFLDEVLPAKASVEKPKLMFGAIAGGVLEIATGMMANGRVGKDFWREEQGNLLVLCEGIETGLSLAVAVPEARVRAALSLNNIGHAPL